jgi:hypothetical protein
MSSRMLYRLSGGTLIAASLLSIVNSILSNVLFSGGRNTTPQQYMSLPWLLVGLVSLIGSLLFVIGLPGMYLRQAGRAGVLGLVGFILVFFGSLLAGAFFTLRVTVFPLLAQVAPKLLEGEILPGGMFLLLLVFSLLDMIGAILLGIATMRAHVFPRLAGVLLIIAGIGMLLAFFSPIPLILAIIETISSIAFDAAFLWCGYVLLAGGRGTVEAAPSPMTEAQTSR